MSEKIKRIGIDARFYGPIGKGLGRYTKEVIDRILKLDNRNEYVIFLSQENFTEFKSENLLVKRVLAPVRWYSLAEQILMPYYIWREKLDLMHFPHFNVPLFCPVKFVVTIHDLILTKYPTQRATTLSPLFYKIKHYFYRTVINSAVKNSEKIIGVSEFTKRDIMSQFNVDNQKIVVTYEGVSENLNIPGRDEAMPRLYESDNPTLSKYNITRPYLLYVGNAYPHKNLERLIKVFNNLKSNNKSEIYDPRSTIYELVLVGKDDYFYNQVKEYAKQFVDNKIIFPGFVPDDDLSVLYKNAMAYVFPSLYEGFGLPPLEAMAMGCPVVSSDAASMREILGEAALYFNPEDEQDMQNKIEEIINHENLRSELINKGLEQVKKYSWNECANKTLEVFNNF